MGSGKFYASSANFNENLKRNRVYSRSLFFAGLFLLGMHINAEAQTFVGGSTENFSVCENTAAYDLGAGTLLNVNDPTGTSDVYGIAQNPANGTLSGAGIGMSFTGGGLVAPGPGLFFYTPNPNFSGNDIFIMTVDNGNGPDSVVINVTVNALPGVTLASSAITICSGATVASFPFTALSNVGPIRNVFSAVGSTSWTVPDGITSLTFDVQGAAGSGNNYGTTQMPGKGGRIQGLMAVTPNEVLNVFVGGQGGTATTVGAAGGWNGGGSAFYYPTLGSSGGTGGAGGGASDIRVGGLNLSNRVIVAGGGGGDGWDLGSTVSGGDGGGLVGGASAASEATSAGGGTQLIGGAAAMMSGWLSGGNGMSGIGGDGSNVGSTMGTTTGGGISGGGGGGYYGGGGGLWNGGGGGSSYSDPTMTSLINNTQGYNAGDGIVALTYNIPGTYAIAWDGDPTAIAAGFTDVSGVPLPTSSFSVAIPSGATAGSTYNGVLTVSNGTCTSTSYPISITINSTPNVAFIGNQAKCNGDMTVAVNPIMGSVLGTTFNWTSDNTSFGLPASGTDSIPSVMVTNPTTAPEVANITITPVANGCTGAPLVFTITANPTPMLTSGATATDICSGSAVSYVPMIATSGTPAFSWRRIAAAGISPATGSGTGAISEALTNSTYNPINVTYEVTTSINGCTDSQTVTVNVNPIPSIIASPVTPSCDSDVISLNPPNNVSGATYTWNRNVVTGIINPAASGAGPINETLINTSPNVATATYNITETANGCTNIENITATVYPTPVLTSPLINAPVCSGMPFNYTPTSSTAGLLTSSYVWIRPSIPGISNSSTTHDFAVSEALVNTTSAPVTVTYYYRITSPYGCASPSYNVSVVVNPKPTLSSPLMPGGMCDDMPITYHATSATTPTSFYWSRASVAGISTGAQLGVGDVNEMLSNTTNSPVAVTYQYTLLSNGCLDTQNVVINVNPSPKFTSTLTPPAQCDSMKFNYNPSSSTNPATFNWTRAYVPGILEPARSGTGNPSELLVNTTNVNVNVTYQYVASANGCNSTPQNVVVTVHPTPKLSSAAKESICTGVPFNYKPTSYVPGATFSWTRPVVSGITPNTNYGFGSISETLTNSMATPLNVQYNYQITANGCTNPTPGHMVLTVNPAPAGSQIAQSFTHDVCSNAMNQMFGAVNAAAAGVTYTWTVQNGTIYSNTPGNQYILVNFNNPGTSVVTLTSTVNGTGCNGSSSVDVNVSNDNADMPVVIYFDKMLVCLQNDDKSYQWGYDDVNTWQSTSIDGATNQSYSINSLDGDKLYWVMTQSANGCWQKTYYNAPPATKTHRSSGDLKVYPNPVVNQFTLEFSNAGSDEMQYDVVNMLGQKLISGTAPEASATINAASLPAGTYLVNCYHNGEKIADVRFTKN